MIRIKINLRALYRQSNKLIHATLGIIHLHLQLLCKLTQSKCKKIIL